MEDGTIIQIVKNTKLMLINRGFDETFINTTLPIGYLKEFIKKFRNGEPCLDIFVQNTDDNRAVYVHFIYELKKSDNAGFLEKMYYITYESHLMTENDSVVFVILSDINENIQEQFNELENKIPNITIFKYKSLMFNLIDHEYVPKHECISERNKEKLKSELMINDLEKLPIIYKTDAVCKYYNFKPGDVIKITRDSLNKKHIAYRYVM
tara:strand:- start:20 stop:646 length:627 start_codon:yes stop_codon:yes gene_type:complete